MKKTVKNKIAKNKFLFKVCISIPIFLLIFLGVIYATYINKGDLNGDGEVDYADVSLLQLHLINSKQLPEDKLKNADMNGDGEITITDLTLLIQKVEKTLEYEVTLRDIEVDNYYPNKKENIKLTFNADVSYGEIIKKVIINGKEYDLEKNESNEGKYEITLNVGDTSGVKDYRFEKAILTNEKEIKIDNVIKVEVLKTKPQVENWTVEEDIEKTELNISFNLTDQDQSFQSGTYRIIEENVENKSQDDVTEYIKTGSLQIDSNHINVKVEENKKYKIMLCIQYELATGGIEQEGETIGTDTIEKELSLILDYKFELSNIKTYQDNEDVKDSEEFTMGNKIIVKFDSTNITQYVPKTAVINGKTYDLEDDENTYVTFIDGFDTIGEQTINIEKVILENGKTFDVNKMKAVKIIKNAPIVVRSRSNESKQESSVQVHLYIKDLNRAITNLALKLYDEKDNEITSKDLIERLTEGNLVKESEEEELKNTYYINTVLNINEEIVTSIYKVKVFASYDLYENDESYVHTNELLSEERIEVAPTVHIENIEVSKKYPEKGENITLTYKVLTNKEDLDITHITINNLKCIATKHIDNDENITYSVTLNVGQQAGILDIETTDFTFENGLSCSVHHNVQVDVLKDKPTSEAFSQVDDIENKTVKLTANIVDPDNAFIAGVAELVRNSDSKIVATKTFNAEEVTFEIDNIELNTQYTLVAKMTYDRDSGKLEEETNQNYVENEIFRTRPIQLIGDYEITISNIKTYNQEKETKYFERGQEVTISFDSTNKTEFYPTYAVINGKQYELERQENTYKTNIPVISTFGPKTVTIEKLILNNTKEIELTQNNQIRVGILKLRPTVSDFGYEETDDNTIHVSFTVNDTEETITGGKIIILDENGEKVKEENFNKNSSEITFPKGLDEEYQVKIIADYDLDTNQITTGDNEYEEQELLSEVINISPERFFEIKDIIGIGLYKQGSILEVTSITEADLSDLSKYIVKVRTKGMPLFYAEIEEYEITENGTLNFILKYDNVIQYNNGRKQNALKVTYSKECHDGVFQNKSIDTLIAEIEANPTGKFELTQDYDASFIKTAGSGLISTFSGTLNGNGHKIFNLNKPLFDTLDSATIENLIFENVTLIGGTSKGSIANTAQNTTITNVHIKGLDMSTGNNECAGMIGNLQAACTIEKCSVTNFKITTSGHIRVSAIAGYMSGGTIKNCYVEGTIDSTQSKDGNGIGGILGHAYGTVPITIENCISKVQFNWTGGGPRLNGGILGLSQSTNTILKNNVSLATGTVINKVYGTNVDRTSTNNYELEESTLISNISGNIVKAVSKNNFTKDFLKDSANFDENIWNLEDVAYDKLPHLKNDDPNKEVSEKPEENTNSNLYIPEYNRIKDTSGFKTTKLITYHNLQKLMPYYDAKYLVVDGGTVATDDILNTKTIKHILPFAENKLVTYLTSKDNSKITSIKVVFEDYTVKEYEVTFEEFKQNVAIYKIKDTKLRYAFGKYVVQEEASIVKTLADYIKNVDYTATLDTLTQAADSRLYKDHFNGILKTQAENIALQFLQNAEESVLNINNSVLIDKIQKELIDSGKINKWIYGYTYYDRWYGFEIAGAKVSDIMLFQGQMYKDTMTIDNLANEVITGNIGVNATNKFYASNIKKYTVSTNIGQFLDSIITNIGGYEDVNDWFTTYFGTRNILAEFGVENKPEVLYRGWYQLKKNERMILPVITLPSNSAYMISGPAQLQFGAQQLYHKDPQTAAGKAEVLSKVNNHLNLVKRHFATLADSFDAAKWNRYCIMVYDCTKAITAYKEQTILGIPTGKIVPVYTQGKVGQEQPFFKNFSEVLGLWQPGGSSAGVGNTAGFLWFQARPGLTNFDTWTHEFEHALYDKIMLYQRGARVQLETLTEGNVQQYANWSENNLIQDVGPYYFNTSFYLNKEGNATQNLTPERINTREKLENYYKGQQNALDLLDYIEGKAFIKLTPEQQAKIATRMNISAGWTSWGGITTAQATAMNLTSLEALYDNRIVLRPNNAWGVSVRGLSVINGLGSNDYGFESVWVNRWFLGHLDGGYADAFSTKRNFFEMLGYAGVDGYVTYGSRASANDLDAIKKITKMVTGTEMDWKQYKMSRYATVEENINNNKYIDVQYMIDRFTEALTNDANNGDRNISQRTNLRKIYYHYLKSATNDFVADPLGTDVEVTHIQTAQELVEKINSKPYGYYVLDNDIDFSEMTTNVTQTFMGRLDGNGHKIIGNKIPVFNKIRYGYVGNLIMENTDIPRKITNAGALAYKIESSTAEKIDVTGLKIYLGNKNDLSLIGGAISNVITRDCTVERLVTKISNKDEFVEKISSETGGLFELTSDIDFTGYTATTNAVITGIFTGKINGNGHTISNLTNLSLFANFRGTVENLNISNFTNTSAGRGNGDFVVAFAQETYTATFKNMKFNNITLSGRNNVAVITGMDGRENANSVFENISVKNANVTGTGVYVSTFAGRKYGGLIKNVYVQGTLNVTSTENGGLVGAMQQGGTIENVITDVAITKTSNTYSNLANSVFNGSMIGNIYNTPKVNSSIAFGNMTGYTDTSGNELVPYKFTGTTEAQVKACLNNCYEVTEEIGSSRVNANTAGHLDTISRQNLNKEFYKNLGFDETIWNLNSINNKGYPELK